MRKRRMLWVALSQLCSVAKRKPVHVVREVLPREAKNAFDEPPQSGNAGGKRQNDLKNTDAGVPQIKPVHADPTEQDSQNTGYRPTS